MTRKLHVGLLLRDRVQLRRWQYEALSALVALPFVKLVLAVIDERPKDRRAPTLNATGGSLWRLYYRHVVERVCHSHQWIDAAHLWEGATVWTPTVELVGRWSEHFAVADTRRIADLELDLLVRFGFGILRGPILTSARGGIWSYHLGDPARFRGGPPGFWEVYEDFPETRATLQCLTEALDAGVILKQAALRTNVVSYVEQLENLAGAAVPLLSLAAAEFQNDPTAIDRLKACESKAAVRHAPTNLQFLTVAGRVLGRRVRLRSR
jgi:hypothetical protein